MPKRQFHERLIYWREKSGRSIDQAAVYALEHLPAGRKFSREKLRRMEDPSSNNPITEEKADEVEIAALANVYGCRVADLSPSAAERLTTLEGLIASSRCTRALSSAAA